MNPLDDEADKLLAREKAGARRRRGIRLRPSYMSSHVSLDEMDEEFRRKEETHGDEAVTDFWGEGPGGRRVGR